MDKLYSKKHLLKALKAAKLPASYPTMLKYETLGVLTKPQGQVIYDDRVWRFYTQKEIDANVQRVKNYLRK